MSVSGDDMNIKKIYKSSLWWFTQKTFGFWQKLGLNLTPIHFYYPIPNTKDLKDISWSKNSELISIPLNDETQLKLLSLFKSQFEGEYNNLPLKKTSLEYKYYINNNSFESGDAEILYSMIRNFKPKKIIEIGSGYSTFLSIQAVQKNKSENKNYDCDFISIEPYPNEILKKGFPGLSDLIDKKVQDVPLAIFSELNENDILFIDSSHVLKTGGDVQYEYLEILPRLKKGVIVHIHDIFLPAEYPKEWIFNEHRFWTEQYLLQAFLTFNESFKVLWAGQYMHLNFPEKLEEAFKSYNRKERNPGSFWIKKIK